MTEERGRLGRLGEEIAAAHLRRKGMMILARNWRSRYGELDIIAFDDGCLVICEVKTRTGSRHGSGVEAVTDLKLARLRRLGAAWLAERRGNVTSMRVDVIGVRIDRLGRPDLEHVVGAG